jgi:hypothetical protein
MTNKRDVISSEALRISFEGPPGKNYFIGRPAETGRLSLGTLRKFFQKLPIIHERWNSGIDKPKSESAVEFKWMKARF